ncbi:TPA: hypothetical protein PXP51_004087 [Yersinia enterocolitica]|nr:hypothetical protein [Yersinia enterocolitica]HDL7822265.1 hypothetical protein [Yersinia enterocolitica]HDL7830238.1 hypothetical protein [Yersinia enterocolitica]HDL7871094.1 hypothetical protein [Yersinia enterocolitica]HDL7884778.1 hypothetical protein [Yersinia enterocolitica]
MAVMPLIETPDLRERLQKYLTEKDVEKVLLKGRQEKFAEWVIVGGAL